MESFRDLEGKFSGILQFQGICREPLRYSEGNPFDISEIPSGIPQRIPPRFRRESFHNIAGNLSMFPQGILLKFRRESFRDSEEIIPEFLQKSFRDSWANPTGILKGYQKEFRNKSFGSPKRNNPSRIPKRILSGFRRKSIRIPEGIHWKFWILKGIIPGFHRGYQREFFRISKDNPSGIPKITLLGFRRRFFWHSERSPSGIPQGILSRYRGESFRDSKLQSFMDFAENPSGISKETFLRFHRGSFRDSVWISSSRILKSILPRFRKNHSRIQKKILSIFWREGFLANSRRDSLQNLGRMPCKIPEEFPAESRKEALQNPGTIFFRI